MNYKYIVTFQLEEGHYTTVEVEEKNAYNAIAEATMETEYGTYADIVSVVRVSN